MCSGGGVGREAWALGQVGNVSRAGRGWGFGGIVADRLGVSLFPLCNPVPGASQ